MVNATTFYHCLRYEESLLRPLLEERLRDSTRKFDTIHLVDFRYKKTLAC